jgi:hypothetical protein
MDNNMIIGAIVITVDGDEGMIIDKVLAYSNSSNYTRYVLMKKNHKVIDIEFDEIAEVTQLPGGNPVYFKRDKDIDF